MLAKFTKLHSMYVNGKLPPHIQEEYLAYGMLDIPYMSNKYNEPCSKKAGNDMINSLFGTIKFVQDEHINEVTLEEFKKHYVFAKYRSVRSWISHIYDATGLLLTKERLFQYVLSLSLIHI